MEVDGQRRVLAIARDVTEIMQWAEQLRAVSEDGTTRAIGGGIAHDFNKILGIIMGYSDLSLGSDSAGESGEWVRLGNPRKGPPVNCFLVCRWCPMESAQSLLCGFPASSVPCEHRRRPS